MPYVLWLSGNELSGSGVSARVDPVQYGWDMKILKGVIDSIFLDPKTRPKVLGPGGFYDQEWFEKLLEVAGPGVIDGLTHHIYNLGAGKRAYINDLSNN